MKSQKGFILPLIIILAIIAGAGYFVYKNKKNELTETQSGPTDAQVKEWDKVVASVPSFNYENKEYGFSFSFPASWSGYVVDHQGADFKFCPPTSEVNYSTIHPDDPKGYECIIYLSAWDKSIPKRDFKDPIYIGENNRYRFYISITKDHGGDFNIFYPIDFQGNNFYFQTF